MVTSNKEHTLFVEKYRSKTLENYVGNEQIKTTISKYIEQNDIQNLIFYGGPGTGRLLLLSLSLEILIMIIFTSMLRMREELKQSGIKCRVLLVPLPLSLLKLSSWMKQISSLLKRKHP